MYSELFPRLVIRLVIFTQPRLCYFDQTTFKHLEYASNTTAIVTAKSVAQKSFLALTPEFCTCWGLA